MAVYGVVTQVETPYDGLRSNRWWVQADSIADALNNGNGLVDVIRVGFGTLNTFVNVHAWLPNSTPNQFGNMGINKPGQYTAGSPTSAVPCVKIEFSAGVSTYQNYKAFRVGVNPDQQVGRNWNTSLSDEWGGILDELSTLDWLVGRGGADATSWSFTNRVYYRQLAKRWYNRGASDGD